MMGNKHNNENPKPDEHQIKANQVELPLTEEEEKMDLTKMYELDLGDHANYKTKLVQKRWQQQR